MLRGNVKPNLPETDLIQLATTIFVTDFIQLVTTIFMTDFIQLVTTIFITDFIQLATILFHNENMLYFKVQQPLISTVFTAAITHNYDHFSLELECSLF